MSLISYKLAYYYVIKVYINITKPFYTSVNEKINLFLRKKSTETISRLQNHN